MKLFHITKSDKVGSHAKQSQYLEKAAKERGFEYVRIVIEELAPLSYLDFSPTQSDIVYRSAAGQTATTLERELLQKGAMSIHNNLESALAGRGSSYDLMTRAKLPVAKSVPFLPKKKKDSVAVADYLGGFPLIIKVMGGMEGVGVMRVDSIESFNSIIDFVRKDDHAVVRIMEYIPHEYYARLVVVGGTAVAATRDYPPLGDFRANARGPRTVKGAPFKPSSKMMEDAVKATAALGVKASGVDLMVASDGKHYLAEANLPFNFAETQGVTGVDIAGHLIDAMSS